MASNQNGSCSWGTDVLTSALGRVGVNRSMLVTLALLPFAWEGVSWFADAIRSLWDLVAGVGS